MSGKEDHIMNYVCTDPAEFIYPDITEYSSGSDRITILAARNSYACAQVLFYNCEEASMKVEVEGWEPEIYQMVAIPVERNQGIEPENFKPHRPERIAPYELFECMKPIRDGLLHPEKGIAAMYLSMRIPSDAKVGVYHCAVKVGEVSIPVELEISRAVVPSETLTILMGYSTDCVARYHGVTHDSREFHALDEQYLKMLRRSHQNMLYCPKPGSKRDENGGWEIDFTHFENYIERHLKLGFKRFNFGLGFRKSWSASEILVNGMPSMSFECYQYLAKLLPQLEALLKAHGWSELFYLGIADEPNSANATEYRALCGLVRKLAPSIRLLDAMSFGAVHGAVDIWIPLNAEYECHKKEFEIFRENGDEIWYYDCCGPRGSSCINRFMDYALLDTRYHFWANYAYSLPGYLHWAANLYQPGQDPFKQSCPEHHNADNVCWLPAGDTHLIYPGEGEPWMSIRLENQRASAEEYEMLCALSKNDKAKADMICSKVFRSFCDVEYDVTIFRAAKNELIRACEAI